MYKQEYPRPQMVRSNWLNLNGKWSFGFDDTDKGLKEKWYKNPSLDSEIEVPFAFQTKLSGILWGYTT